MPKLLQVNVTADRGSTGRIAKEIGQLASKQGWDSWLAYGRGGQSGSHLIRIGDDWDMKCHAIQTRLFDRQGLSSKKSTLQFVSEIQSLAPDIIHLHVIHGYYLNYPILFEELSKFHIPVVWTFHDCWPFTGHCAYYSFVQCPKWETGCCRCPQRTEYPASFFLDRSRSNWVNKKYWFTSLGDNLHIVTVSDWLKSQVGKSFFKEQEVRTIHNGVDLKIFYPRPRRYKQDGKFLILGVASVWNKRKGLNDFVNLRNALPSSSYEIILIGLSDKQIRTLPKGIRGIQRTENVNDLAEYYSSADVYINTSVEETLGMTSLEAQACGTPVIVYNSTACPETISRDTGLVVQPRNIQELVMAVKVIESNGKEFYSTPALNWVKQNFNSLEQYKKYLEFYEHLLNIN